MNLGLNGKRALVLGSSQGIGAEIAKVLAREGCNVYVGARRLDHIQSLANELREEFKLYANVRPAISFIHNRRVTDKIDLVIEF